MAKNDKEIEEQIQFLLNQNDDISKAMEKLIESLKYEMEKKAKKDKEKKTETKQEHNADNEE